jgi:hypothetical protein
MPRAPRVAIIGGGLNLTPNAIKALRALGASVKKNFAPLQFDCAGI